MIPLKRCDLKPHNMTASLELSIGVRVFQASKEKRFARRAVKSLLKSHSAVTVEKPELSGKALYREVLLHARQVDPSSVDRILLEAEDSIDEWTAGARRELEFRQVVHFFVLSQYLADGHAGTVVSFRNVVYKLIPANL